MSMTRTGARARTGPTWPRAGAGVVALAVCMAVTAFSPIGTSAATTVPRTASAPDPTPPNILLIVSDDQAWPATFSPQYNPTVYADLVDKGVLFNRAYDSTSECCPSRSEIMTGLYENHTGV